MLRECDIKVGDFIYFIDKQKLPKFYFTHFTKNRAYEVLNIDKGYYDDNDEFEYIKIFVINDNEEMTDFDIGSILANCFVTHQEHRKLKLEELNNS